MNEVAIEDCRGWRGVFVALTSRVSSRHEGSDK
jgi:hypothetical protein